MKKIFTIIIFALSSCLIMQLKAQNLLTGWDGNGVTGTLSKPSDVGWINASATTANLWTVANGSGGCRFRDSGVTGGYTANSISLENSPTTFLTSRIMMVRWDNNSYSKSYYAYPVTLDANSTYTYSMNYFYGGSGSAGLTLNASISAAVDTTGKIATQVFTSTAVNIMRSGSFSFSTTNAGTYYLVIGGAWAWFGISNLSIIKNNDLLDDLNAQYKNLTLGNLSAVSSNLTLPTTLGTKGVKVRWTSSNPLIIDTLGVVRQPAQYNSNVTLTATLSQTVSGSPFLMSKVFTATVIGIIPTPDEVATWDFNTENISLESDTLRVTDTNSGFKGKLVNQARIRTIGTTEHINVLDLGTGTGYFDMGTDIGKAIYSLTNHTIMGYFRVNEAYTNLASAGNYYWNFSNSNSIGTSATGFMYGRLSGEAAGISAAGSPSTSANAATPAPIGAWHHFAYILHGDTGTVYIDGIQTAQNLTMPAPATALAKANLTGTLYNWLGRSCWTTDAYLQQTLLYDFRVLSVAVSVNDITNGYTGFDAIQTTLDRLNIAYSENPDYTAPELTAELNNLTLGDLSAVKTDITLPVKGTLDNSIDIIWKTTNTNLISSTGAVTRPNYYNYNDTLTATLTKNGQSLVKTFPATVIVKDGTQFANDLLVKYDFSSVSDSIVTDAAEMHFKGTLKNNAKVHSIGSTIKYNVLSLGDSIGYFDMGPEIGKLMYNLTDYTMSAYYRVDTSYTATLATAGNFLWSFSNGTAELTVPNGYIFGSLKDQSVSITPGNYSAGSQSVSLASPALTGGWHNFTYVQSGATGTLYVDGSVAVPETAITNLPSTTLPKNGNLGTLYNWIGRSCYAGDAYLRKTLVYDFRLYKTALTDVQIQNEVLNVGSVINALDAAYVEEATNVKSITDSNYKVIPNVNGMHILGLNGTEKITLFDVTGRQLKVTNSSNITVNAGVYIVKINDYITKVMVK
jgi:hypothetical protein